MASHNHQLSPTGHFRILKVHQTELSESAADVTLQRLDECLGVTEDGGCGAAGADAVPRGVQRSPDQAEREAPGPQEWAGGPRGGPADHGGNNASARRLSRPGQASLVPTQSPARPVVDEQSRLQPSHEELTLDQELHNTETQLGEMEALPEKGHRPLPQKTSQELYHQPDVKRVKVYHSGDRHVSVHVRGQSIEELLNYSTARLALSWSASRLYAADGRLLSSWVDIHRDMLLCVSTGQPFISPKDCGDKIEMRATFARMMRSLDSGNTTTDRGPKEHLTTTIPCGCHSLHWTAEA
ncbi:doublecortin domain-containing protein 1-like isoform 1-T2 [Salvelinus alpinus]